MLIDRFDGRHELLEIPQRGGNDVDDIERRGDESEAMRSQFEAYRDLLLLETSGLSEHECIARISAGSDDKTKASESSTTTTPSVAAHNDGKRRTTGLDPFRDLCEQYDGLSSALRTMLGKVAALFGVLNLAKQVRMDQLDSDSARRTMHVAPINNDAEEQRSAHKEPSSRARPSTAPTAHPLPAPTTACKTESSAATKALTPMEKLRLKAQELINKQLEKDRAKDAEKQLQRDKERLVSEG